MDQSNFFTFSSVSLCEKGDPGFLLPALFEGLLPFILLCFNTKMETLVQLKNNPFLMGLCRNCPPPDLQYDNSSGKSQFNCFSCFFLSHSELLVESSNDLFLLPELYRISTFARFPSSGVTERSLARAGWFYTGVGDRVQCFKCNVTAEGWQAGDCPTEKHRQLSPSCTFIQSLPSTSNLLSSSHSAFSPLRIAPAIPVRPTRSFYLLPNTYFPPITCFSAFPSSSPVQGQLFPTHQQTQAKSQWVTWTWASRHHPPPAHLVLVAWRICPTRDQHVTIPTCAESKTAWTPSTPGLSPS